MSNLGYITDEKWGLKEESFNSKWLRKYESIMSQGNGYFGLRASTEEAYVSEKRGMFLAGLFNKFDDNEVSELVNLPDMIEVHININGETLDLNKGQTKNYQRELDLKTGELLRVFEWIYKELHVKFEFKRIVSFDLKHILAQQIRIENLGQQSFELEIISGINGQITNTGTQHLSEGPKQMIEGKVLQMTSETTSSQQTLVQSTVHQFDKNGEAYDPKARVEMERRKIQNKYWMALAATEYLTIEKISAVHSTRDFDSVGVRSIHERALADLKEASALGYEKLKNQSIEAWNNKVWNNTPITIKSVDPLDQLAVIFAQYHMHVMTPGHDSRMNIGAKGLSGEGYKGHTFWDTEIFLLPYFTFSHPEIARSLIEYRHNSIEGARQKAKKNGYEGAQYPWESAWITDGETTPDFIGTDIVTGKPMKVLTGYDEIHITGDVAYGLKQYIDVTNDKQLLSDFGFEIIVETAIFWSSRLEWNNTLNRYEINDVIGPDEYTEHANNNAYTNYIAFWNMQLALKVIENIESYDEQVIQKIEALYDLKRLRDDFTGKLSKIFLQQPNSAGIIPQDDDFFEKEVIDITKYKKAENVGTIFHDYNMSQVSDLQVLKQADVMLLIYLFENEFSNDIKMDNFHYYETITTHDSSLSLSTHSSLAADLDEMKLSYELFKKATEIDMGQQMSSSDEGIHAASLGGIWQTVVYGYGGVRNLEGTLRIEPKLPDNWEQLQFSIYWQGCKLTISVTNDGFEVINHDANKEIQYLHNGEYFTV